MHLASAHTRSRRGIVPIIAPRGMVEVNYKITAIHFADGDIEVVAQIGLSRNDAGGFVLSAALAVTLAGVDQKTAGQLVESAHAVCPYSKPKAIRWRLDRAVAETGGSCSDR
jgi:hypothetical protein